MAIPNYSMATVPQFVGRSLGISEWVTVGQDRIDQFATCTGDRQWIHVDVERAKRESPFAHQSPMVTLPWPWSVGW
jgi:acyl dehydratase